MTLFQWLRKKLRWFAFCAPAKAKGGDPTELPNWVEELNLGVQRIAASLPTPWDPANCESYRKIEQYVADWGRGGSEPDECRETGSCQLHDVTMAAAIKKSA